MLAAGETMRGSDRQTGSMFSYVSPEALVPPDHPLRPIRVLVNRALERLSGEFDELYAAGGRDEGGSQRRCSHARPKAHHAAPRAITSRRGDPAERRHGRCAMRVGRGTCRRIASALHDPSPIDEAPAFPAARHHGETVAPFHRAASAGRIPIRQFASRNRVMRRAGQSGALRYAALQRSSEPV
jgi:hypothetical protein